MKQKIKEFDMKFDNLYLCSSNSELKHILSIDMESENGAKFTIASWIESGDEYDLRFVGDRPLFENVDWQLFRKLVQIGQLMLEGVMEDDY